LKSISKTLTTASRIVSDYEDKYVFNASEVLGLLLQIKELREFHISMNEIFDGAIQLTVGSSTYQIFLTNCEDTT